MNVIDFLKGLLVKLNWWQKIIVLIALSVIVYFSTGCAYKFHADNIDNVTREIIISR